MLTSQLFWIAVSFVLFIGLIFKPVGKALSAIFDARASRIQDELDEALRLKEEAQALLASYQRKQKEVVDEAAHIIAHAEEESKRIMDEAEHQLEENVNRRIEVAMQKIASYEATVLHDIRSNAVDIAVGTVRALIAENLGKDLTDELIEVAVEDIEKKLH